ncbi:MAG: TolC family protein [bacterium]
MGKRSAPWRRTGETGRRSRLARIIGAMLVVGAAPPATSQQPPSPSSPPAATLAQLTLDQALAEVLSSNATILASRQARRYNEGVLLSTRGNFDVNLHAGVSNSRDRSRLPVAASGVTAPTVLTNASNYALSADRLLRSGITLTSQLALARTGVSSATTDPLNRSSADVGVVVPLGRGRGGGIITASERSALLTSDASERDVRQTTAQAVLSAVSAYWEYRSAQERLLVYREAEVRAGRMVDETRALIEADERPPADLLQVRSNLATKQTTTIGAEQTLIEARRQLGLQMGRSADQIDELPAAGTFLPQLTDSSAALAESDGQWLLDGAADRRMDLSAARLRTSAADRLRVGASRDLQSQLDVSLNLGYSAMVQGARFPSLVAPIYQNVPGVNATVKISYGLPVSNLYANGLALQSTAAYEQSVVQLQALERNIESGKRVALSALRNSRLAMARAHEAVQLAREAVTASSERFRLGVSTLFDVILAEDALTQAMLGDVGARGRYANALAGLRFETGTILDADNSLTTDAARFVRLCSGADRC